MGSKTDYLGRAVLVAGLVALFVGCAPTKVAVNVIRPAEINLSKFKRVAVGEISGRGGADLSGEITEALFTSQRFEVLDRQHLSQVMDEHDLGTAGLIDENTVMRLGEFLGASALLVGRTSDVHDITNLTYRDEKYSDGYVRIYTREAAAFMTANLRLIDCTTGKVIAVKTIPAQDGGTLTQRGSAPARIDPTALYATCRRDIVDAFMTMVAPYQETVRVFFEEDRDIPSMVQGVNSAKISDWESARKCFHEALDAAKANPKKSGSPKAMAKFHYNLGVAYLYGGDCEGAEQYIKQAYRLNPKPQYAEQLGACERIREDLRKLEEQAVSP